MKKIENKKQLEAILKAIDKLEYLKGIVKEFRNQDKLDMCYDLVFEYLGCDNILDYEHISPEDFFDIK